MALSIDDIINKVILTIIFLLLLFNDETKQGIAEYQPYRRAPKREIYKT